MLCLFIKNISLKRKKAMNYHVMKFHRKLANFFLDIHYRPVVYSGILACTFDLKRHSRILKHCSRISEKSKANTPFCINVFPLGPVPLARGD